jgi:alpha-D-xyloside xylohydrolase
LLYFIIEFFSGGVFVTGFFTNGVNLSWNYAHETLVVEPYGLNSLRVRSTQQSAIRDDLPQALLPIKSPLAQIRILDDQAVITNGMIQARINCAGQIGFFNTTTGVELFSEEPSRHYGQSPARHFKSTTGDNYRLEVRFPAHPGERFYGLGQHKHGFLDQKGCVIDLIQENSEVCIPFLLSNRNYGFLWNNPGVGRVELGQYRTRWVAESTQQMDYWVTCGSTPAQIMEQYSAITGRVPLLPEWAAGFWQCKLRYQTQDELLEVAREYKKRGLPLSVIVVDYFHWTAQGDWQFDPACWPDPQAMVNELNEMGVKLMVSIWPTVSPHSTNYEHMEKNGWLIRTERGIASHRWFVDSNEKGRIYPAFYDATHPEARTFIWQKIRQGYYRFGIKVWWLDACEPEISPLDPDNLRYHLGNGLQVTNIYPMLNQQAIFEGMQSEGEQDVVTLCRSAWAGSQRYGAAVWSGDIPSTFESLQQQIRAGLNIGLSGIPWWTTDIGGFHSGNPTTPYFRELIVRWFQYGVFCPLFRLHGVRMPNDEKSGAPNEIWSFGDEAYPIIRELLLLRERLKPYIMTQMQTAHMNGTPPMRPLFFDFPNDSASFAVDDQFMFGPDLLVAPILNQGDRSRKVYLPAGSEWCNAWTEKSFHGGIWVEVDAPLEIIPLFLRGKAHLPIKSG